jgi:thiamine transport system permease protein
VDGHRPALTRAATLALPALFLALFFAYPLAAIVGRGLSGEGSVSVPGGVAWFTVWQAAASTALSLALGLPLAAVIGRYAFPGRALARALVLVPFVLPTVVVAGAFLALGLDRGVPAILAAHVFFNVAVVVRVVGSYWARLDPRLWDGAATLGAGAVARFRHVTLPLLAPALAAAGTLVFLFCFTSFGVILILGGPAYATLETEIYNSAARLFDLRTAAVLSLVQLGAVAAILGLSSLFERRLQRSVPLVAEEDRLRRPAGGERWLVAAVLALSGLALGLPLAALVERSLDGPGGYGLVFYRELGSETSVLLVEPWRAILGSLLFATAATALALVVGGLAAVAVARRRAGWLDVLVMLPLGASAVMLGFGFVIAFDDPPLDLRGSPWLVPIAQSLVAAPFVVRIVAPALRSIDERLHDAAAVLGASPARVRREIDLPLVLRAFGVAAGFAFAISLGEFGATLFVARADWPTVPVAIFAFLGRPGAVNQGIAASLAVVLMVVTALAALASDRIGGSRGAL